MQFFEYRHIVGFEETNVVGNVYYANHIGLALVTLSVSCDYYHELCAFDELAIRMSLADLSHHRMALGFEYWRISEGKSAAGKDAQSSGTAERGEVLVARGQQELGCMGRRDGKLEPQAWPASLLEALRPYAGG